MDINFKYKMNRLISYFITFLLVVYVSEFAIGQEGNDYDSNKAFHISLTPYLNSNDIPINTEKTLRKIGRIIQQFPEISLQVKVHDSGYDFEKDSKLNKSEAKKRSEILAQNMYKFLVKIGVAESSLSVEGKGSEEPFLFNQKDAKTAFTLSESKYAYIKNARIILELKTQYADELMNLELELEAEKIPYWF